MVRQPDGSYRGALCDEAITAAFDGAADFSRRALRVGAHTLYLYAIDGLTSGGDISELVVKPLLQDGFGGSMDELCDRALYATVYNAVALECETLSDALDRLVNGFAVVLFGQRALAFEDKTDEKRSPSPPEAENTVKGAKDALTETLRTNTGLVRRMKRRLSEPDIDGLVTPASVEEYLTGSRRTAFPLLKYTERTDRLARSLLDGRIALLVDGLPLAYLAPVDLAFFMTAAGDEGTDWLSASFLRILRYAGLLLSLLLPGLYIAMAAYHPQMLPMGLLRSIIESKQAVPFPTAVEVLGLLLAFELLQEAGVSLPQAVGQTLSIIGGLVVGTAAVEARVISPAALIVVAAAGICGFVLPGRDFADAMRLWRFLLAVLAVLGGLFGLTVGGILLLLHLAGLESFGRPYLAPFSSMRGFRALLRPRHIKTLYRDPALRPQDIRNQKP